VSVLVDQNSHWEGQGENLRMVIETPSPETMNRITQLVSAAVGLVPERGDRLVVETLPFESTHDQALPPDALSGDRTKTKSPFTPQNVVTGLALLAVATAVGFVLRSHRRPAPAVEPAGAKALAAGEAPAALALAAPQATVQQIFATPSVQRELTELQHRKQLEAAGAALKQMADDAVDLTKTNSELCAGVLRGWLNEKPELREKAS
jgi:flagellar M-ring protein FliF